MELEEPQFTFKPLHDKRLHMPEPPPVRLLAIDDVRQSTAPGIEPKLDEFYVGLLKFERDSAEASSIAYRAERFRVCFDVVEQPVREDLRPTQVLVPHFHDLVQTLVEQEIPHEMQRSLSPGTETVLLRDPAGNWVSVGPLIEVR